MTSDFRTEEEQKTVELTARCNQLTGRIAQLEDENAELRGANAEYQAAQHELFMKYKAVEKERDGLRGDASVPEDERFNQAVVIIREMYSTLVGGCALCGNTWFAACSEWEAKLTELGIEVY